MDISIRTITLKLYKPSLNKRIIIDEAMDNYSKAFQYLLDKAFEEIEIIKANYKDNNGRYRAYSISKWIDENLNKKLNEFSIEPFKDSIKIDFASTISGYLNYSAKGNFANYPFVYVSSEQLDEEYNKLMVAYMEKSELSSDLSNVSDIEDKIEKLIYKSEQKRTLYFCRYSTKRNYCLVHDCKKNRYYAKIYLMNVKNEKRKKLAPPSGKIFRYIDKNSEIFKESSKKNCFILLPLAFGKWQEQCLKEAIDNPEIMKTARLAKNKNEYFLSINIVKEKPETIKAPNYMGICRGIQNAVNYSIVDTGGKQLLIGSKKIENYILDNKIHEISNELIKIAKEYKCQIIMENLTDKSDNLDWKDKEGKDHISQFNYSNYNKLINILNYKVQDSELPQIIKVSSINIFYSCPYCGKNSKANRFSDKIMICTRCGKTIDIEEAGSLNLARKLIKYNNDIIKIKVENTEKGIRFANKELNIEYYPTNPYDCIDEFKNYIYKIVKDFYDNINVESKDDNFRKKYSLIKKIEAHSNVLELFSLS